MSVQTKIIDGKRKVILDEDEYHRLLAQAGLEPALPEPNARGHYPAVETIRAILARRIIRERQALGLSQPELAKRAGVRQQTLSRLETGKHAPNVRTVDKIDRALKEAERQRRKKAARR